MSRLLLDTTFLIDSMRSPDVVLDVIDDAADVAISAVSVTELLVGVELATGKTRTRRRALVEEAVSAMRVLAYDLSVVGHHADLLVFTRRAGKPRGAHDLLIAATARAGERTVVTADVSAFDDLPGVAVATYPR
ncbi:MAG: type II toxin-antitoxin system VapC family toxin [Acidimicrobiia bacterium]